MTFDGSADLDAMLGTDFGVPVTLGGITVNGIENTRDDQSITLDGGSVLTGRHHTILIRTGTLPGFKQNASIVVNGITYTVGRTYSEQDGQLTRADLMDP